jgi:di/tricarboxylate transporter
MTWQAWYTLAVTLIALYLLARESYGPANVMMGAVIALLLARVITASEAFAGFGNSAPITVAALYILARSVEKTGLLQPVLALLLGRGSQRGSLGRLTVASAGASAFLNNTPLVAMLIPPITDWAERNGQSPSRYLMPLSYAVILGGVVTLIGTSTNLVVSGLLDAKTGQPMGMFEITPIGLPVAVAGVLVLTLTASRLLPERRPARKDLTELEAEFREFSLSMRVVPNGPLAGRTVEEAGLRNLQGVFLAEVERGGEQIVPVASTTRLQGGDRLCFVGRVDQVVDLQAMRGLESTEQHHMKAFDTARHTFFEAVVGVNSPLVGKTLKEAQFRSRYQAAVAAIHRAGQRVNAKLGDVELRVGDTLLLLADPAFRSRWRDRSDFLLVSQFGGTPPGVTKKAWFVGLVIVLVVLVAGAGFLPMLEVSLLAAVALVAFGVLTAGEARNAVDLDVIIMVAASFGIGAAMEKSGLAGVLAGGLVDVFDGLGPMGVLLGVILATSLVTELITNNAAAALLFPIAYATAIQIGADPRLFAIAVATMASTSFLTPIGYQTNTMVYGPGGYRFGDYARLGAPLTIVVIVTILAVARFWYGLG